MRPVNVEYKKSHVYVRARCHTNNLQLKSEYKIFHCVLQLVDLSVPTRLSLVVRVLDFAGKTTESGLFTTDLETKIYAGKIKIDCLLLLLSKGKIYGAIVLFERRFTS